MLKHYIFPVGLILISFGVQGEVRAGQSLKMPSDSQGETLQTGQATLEKIPAYPVVT